MAAAFFTGPMLDLLGRRPGTTLILTLTSLGIFGAYSFQPGPYLTFSLTLAVYGVSAVLTALNTLTTELFPTEIRGTAFALANNIIGRTGYWISPFLVGYFADTHGWSAPIKVAATFPLVALCLVWLWLPETKGRELEDRA
jgi:MFS transporter, putative metabolite:H+ symporter